MPGSNSIKSPNLENSAPKKSPNLEREVPRDFPFKDSRAGGEFTQKRCPTEVEMLWGPSCVIAFGKSEVKYHPILGNSMNVWADLNTSSNYTGRRSLWALRPGKLEAHGLCVAQNNHQRFQIITRNVHRIAAIQNRRFILGKKHVTSKCGLAILSAFHVWACDT